MEAKDLLKKVRNIEIKTRRLSNNIFGGEYHSTFKGKGMTFNEVRNYQFGDDVRSIDWNVTARYNEPYVKVFEEERELTLMLVADISKSGNFSSSSQIKSSLITEICATLAFSAIQNNDKVGLILFSDQIELYIPAKKGKSHILRIIRELIEFKPKSNKTNLNNALVFLSNVLKKKVITFILSDFIDDNYQKTLAILIKKHDITGIRIYDKYDERLPDLGMVQFEDEETGEIVYINTSSKKNRTTYDTYQQKLKLYFEDSFIRGGAGRINLEMQEDYVKKLLTYFKNRA